MKMSEFALLLAEQKVPQFLTASASRGAAVIALTSQAGGLGMPRFGPELVLAAAYLIVSAEAAPGWSAEDTAALVEFARKDHRAALESGKAARGTDS